MYTEKDIKKAVAQQLIDEFKIPLHSGVFGTQEQPTDEQLQQISVEAVRLREEYKILGAIDHLSAFTIYCDLELYEVARMQLIAMPEIKVHGASDEVLYHMLYSVFKQANAELIRALWGKLSKVKEKLKRVVEREQHRLCYMALLHNKCADLIFLKAKLGSIEVDMDAVFENMGFVGMHDIFREQNLAEIRWVWARYKEVMPADKPRTVLSTFGIEGLRDTFCKKDIEVAQAQFFWERYVEFGFNMTAIVGMQYYDFIHAAALHANQAVLDYLFTTVNNLNMDMQDIFVNYRQKTLENLRKNSNVDEAWIQGILQQYHIQIDDHQADNPRRMLTLSRKRPSQLDFGEADLSRRRLEFK